MSLAKDLSDTLKNKFALKNHSHNIIDLIYPIGSIYMSVNNVNPSTLFGGTWEQLKDKFLLGAGDTYNNGETGGEATHTLTENEMPLHSHQEHEWNIIVSADGNTGSYTPNYSGNNWTIARDDRDWNTYRFTGSKGGGASHNNMPPYLVIFIWKRIE